MSMTEIIMERDALKQQLSASQAREEAYRAEVVKLSGELTEYELANSDIHKWRNNDAIDKEIGK